MALYTSYRQTNWQFIQFLILQNNQKFLKIDNLAAIFRQAELNQMRDRYLDMETSANKKLNRN